MWNRVGSKLLRIISEGVVFSKNANISSFINSSTLRSVTTAAVLKKFPVTMKLESSLFKKLFTPELITLSELFKKYGHEIRMAGGAVRDLLMDKMPADIDFATTATPDEMKAMFEAEDIRMINMNGEKHGTITARINDKDNFEITTLRIDVITDGRHAQVEFTKNWELDAGRRDLTINSLFLDFDGTVYDYFSGVEDLKNRRVKFVGNPEQRIREDYLRILRYFRFYGRIVTSPTQQQHDEKTLKDIRNNMAGLKQISGERIWLELRKILQERRTFDTVMLKFLELGGGSFVGLPENVNIEEFQRVASNVKKFELELEPITLISALIHNDSEAQKLNTRLRLSAFERDLCLFLLKHRNKTISVDPKSLPLREYQSIILFTKSKPDDTRSWIEETLMYDGSLELYQLFKNWSCPKFPITGHMLMDANVPAGIMMSRVMFRLKELWLESDFTLTLQSLMSQVPEVLAECKRTPIEKPKKKK